MWGGGNLVHLGIQDRVKGFKQSGSMKGSMLKGGIPDPSHCSLQNDEAKPMMPGK